MKPSEIWYVHNAWKQETSGPYSKRVANALAVRLRKYADLFLEVATNVVVNTDKNFLIMNKGEIT